MRKPRVLVTGGAGFLGSHLCDRLLKDGNDVICIDNLFTGSKDNIRHLLGNPYFEFIRQDVIQPFFVECDQIYNLACPASPIWYQKDPIYTFKTSVYGAMNCLGLAKRTGARVLQASTSEIYGDPSVHPQPENYWGNVNTIGIRSCYDEGKRAAETLFFDYYRKHNVDIKVMRIFNTYGPRMDIGDGRVVSNFIVQALKGTIKELAKIVIELTGSTSKLVYESLPSDDPTQRKPVIELAEKELGWKPSVQLREGLSRTIEYFEELV